jgi:hypothetical protein
MMENSLWFKIGWAIVLGAMVLYLWPKTRASMDNSPKAGAGDWKAVLIPVVMVVLFVMLLIYGVRN